VVNDQHGSPTLASDPAAALVHAAGRATQESAAWGAHHFCNAGETTWYGLAGAVADLDHRVAPSGKAAVYSVLDTSTWRPAFRMVPRPWREALDEVLCELT